MVMIFAATLLASCGSDTSSTEQTGSVTGVVNEGAKSTAGLAGTTAEQEGDAKTGHSSAPGVEQIKQDLIGKSIHDPHLGEWQFESLSEFLSFSIESQKEFDGRIEYVIGMQLKDVNDGLIYNGQATVVYVKLNGLWQFSEVSGAYRSGQPSI